MIPLAQRGREEEYTNFDQGNENDWPVRLPFTLFHHKSSFIGLFKATNVGHINHLKEKHNKEQECRECLACSGEIHFILFFKFLVDPVQEACSKRKEYESFSKGKEYECMSHCVS